MSACDCRNAGARHLRDSCDCAEAVKLRHEHALCGDQQPIELDLIDPAARLDAVQSCGVDVLRAGAGEHDAHGGGKSVRAHLRDEVFECMACAGVHGAAEHQEKPAFTSAGCALHANFAQTRADASDRQIGVIVGGHAHAADESSFGFRDHQPCSEYAERI